MHGRVKVRTTEEQKEKARQEKIKKAKSYQNAMKIVLDKRSTCSYDQEALDITANLLTGNPDIITLWNYRREIFLNLKNEDDLESYQKLLEKDLGLTEQCLRVNPKSYGSWHHRIWILDNTPEPNWEKELMLCTKYLQLDERNFHCWDYRRIVTERSNIPDLSEYKYTLEKIETNFSNYSAWHLRSKLLPRIFPDPEKKFPIDETKHKEELELVENAAFTDPNDQSAWFYLRWLLNLTEPKTTFVFVEAKENEIVVVTSRSVKLNVEFGIKVDVEINGELSNGVWSCIQNNSCVWSFKPESKIQETDSIYLILKENHSEYRREKIKPLSAATFKPNFLSTFSVSLIETLKNQLSTCEELLELEPDSKWTLLTSIFLMLSVDSNKFDAQIKNRLDKLCSVDPLRKGYYLDLRNKIVIESGLVEQFKCKMFKLSCQNLSHLYHSQFLCHFEEIDLSNNDLSGMGGFDVLLNCRYLNLSKNKIKCFREVPYMHKLEVLVLDDNFIEELDWEVISKKLPCLKRISLRNNPIGGKEIDELGSRLGNIEINYGGS